MRKIFKRILGAVISFALAVIGTVAGVFPATLSVQADTAALTYEQTNVMDDLKSSTINGEPFSLTKYSFNAFKETQVLSFVEYCYSFYQNLQDNFGLYIYVYNPKGLNFDVNHGLNSIQLAYGASTSTNYHKYPLQFLNCSKERNYERLFYKFKVVLTAEERQAILATVNSNERVYRISGIELMEQGNTNPTEFTVGTTYRYSGYASGYGSEPSAGNTLTVKSEQSEVLTLNVHATQYRPSGTNGKNNYTQDSLHSVYFAVPNDIIRKYGAMTAVHAIWKDAVLKPMLVTGNQTAYEAILPYIGKDMRTHNEDLDYTYLGAYRVTTASGMGSLTTHSYGYAFNRVPSWSGNWTYHEYYGQDVSALYGMYYAGNGTDSADNYTVSTEEILAKLKESKTKYGTPLVNDKYSAVMFESYADKFTDVNIEAEETYSLTSQKISQTFWEKLRGDSHVESTTRFDGIEAIHAVTNEDFLGTAEEACARLYISKADFEEFKSYYDANKSLCTVYLFRYQTSDYISQEATLLKEGTSFGAETWEEVDTNAYFFQQTVNLDFDIIDVTFSNGSVDTVIPVVSNPIDIIPEATPPAITTSDKENEWLKWLKIIAVVLVLVIIFSPILKPFFEAVGHGAVWLITSPFKAIGRTEKKRKERNRNEKDG